MFVIQHLLRWQRQEDYCEFKATLFYTKSLKTVQTRECSPNSSLYSHVLLGLCSAGFFSPFDKPANTHTCTHTHKTGRLTLRSRCSGLIHTQTVKMTQNCLFPRKNTLPFSPWHYRRWDFESQLWNKQNKIQSIFLPCVDPANNVTQADSKPGSAHAH